MKNKVVSIVMPVYNPDQKHLEMALSSIDRQQHKPMELVISDDSEMVTPWMEYLLHQYENKVELRYFKNENGRGIFSNLNNAIRHSKGDYIQIFSQDDVMKDEFIANQLSAFELNENIGMVFSAFDAIDGSNHSYIPKSKKVFDPKVSMVITAKEATDMFIRYGCFMGNISPVMIRREVFESTGYFNESLKFASDFEFWVRIGKSNNLFYNHVIGLSVRDHPKRASYTLSHHQLMKDLTIVYKLLLESIPNDQIEKSRRYIHKTVGAPLVHHALREALRLNWPFSELKMRFHDLNEYPFNFMRAMWYYLLSMPGRIWNHLVTL